MKVIITNHINIRLYDILFYKQILFICKLYKIYIKYIQNIYKIYVNQL
jgi:hypothetical protein